MVGHDVAGRDVEGLELRRDPFAQDVRKWREKLDPVEGADVFPRLRDLGVRSEQRPRQRNRACQAGCGQREQAGAQRPDLDHLRHGPHARGDREVAEALDRAEHATACRQRNQSLNLHLTCRLHQKAAGAQRDTGRYHD